MRYLIASYQFSGYLPFWTRRFTLSENVQLAYGQGIGDTKGLPPYKRFYAGGPDTVRGFLEDTLGPVDSNGNPYGGNLLTVSQTELLVSDSARNGRPARARACSTTWATCSRPMAPCSPGEDRSTPVTYKFSFHAAAAVDRSLGAVACAGAGHVPLQPRHAAQHAFTAT